MTWAAVIRVVALIAVAALFVTDYGLALWAKEIGTSVYLFLVAVALGVDATWLREVAKSALLRAFGVGKDT